MNDKRVKWCRGCKGERPVESFSQHPRNGDGLQTYCRDCQKVQRRMYYLQNREREIVKALAHAKAAPASVEYKAWCAMKHRCLNVNNQRYSDYGGRGIRVCDQWQNSFQDFLKDVGRRPGKNYSLDRINNDGDYEPGNCRWATDKQQANNRRVRQF